MKVSVPAAVVALIGIAGLVWSQHPPESALRGSKRFERKVVVTGLANPWEITWGPDNKLWVTERTGKRVTRIDPNSGEQSVAVQIDEVSAPGGQEGLLGLALHPQLLKNAAKDFVYLAYTYTDEKLGADPNVTDAKSPYRYFYAKVVRFIYTASDGKLANPVEVISGLPAGNDHVGGRLKFGPDSKLYLTLGDQGHAQGGNFCLPIESQRTPTKAEVQKKDYSAYVGKTLRLNLDGSIPSDNPKFEGVVSHVYTMGHRNTQGIDFAPDGTYYAGEHGPKTDDEVNILVKGGNYGWPNVAGLKDDKAYEFAPWSTASTPCSQLKFSEYAIHPSVAKQAESAYAKPFVEPIFTLFTVPTGHNFRDPACGGIDYICWPTVGVSSIEHYQFGAKGIPGWDRVLLITTLKRGSLYVLPLDRSGKKAVAPISRYFRSENRYRDSAVSPDGRTIYVATDSGGLAENLSGGTSRRMQDRGSILAFTYTGEGTGTEPEDPRPVSSAQPSVQPPSTAIKTTAIADAVPPQFTSAQAALGKTAYNSSCATCHGSNLTNATMGTPLAGDYFRKNWAGKSVRELYDRAQKTMPPGAPGSLPAETYANMTAYILEVNGLKAGAAALPAGGTALDKMVIR